jgi:hypothetical protein
LAITTGDWLNAQCVSFSTEHQPCTVARLLLLAVGSHVIVVQAFQLRLPLIGRPDAT